MKNLALLGSIASISLAAVMTGCTGSLDAPKKSDTDSDAGFLKPALPEKSTLRSTGRNPYFILEPGYQLVLKKAKGEETLTITVLNETRTLDGVETRVIEERDADSGKLIEIARNYFAIQKDTGDLFYFGEDVDNYKAGKIDNHNGSWLAGVNGAVAGLMMPGTPAAGMKFCQEQAPGVAMDRSEILSAGEEAKVPAGSFTRCLRVRDDSAISKEEPDLKLYAPGVGLIADEDFELVKIGHLDAK